MLMLMLFAVLIVVGCSCCCCPSVFGILLVATATATATMPLPTVVAVMIVATATAAAAAVTAAARIRMTVMRFVVICAKRRNIRQTVGCKVELGPTLGRAQTYDAACPMIGDWADSLDCVPDSRADRCTNSSTMNVLKREGEYVNVVFHELSYSFKYIYAHHFQIESASWTYIYVYMRISHSF